MKVHKIDARGFRETGYVSTQEYEMTPAEVKTNKRQKELAGSSHGASRNYLRRNLTDAQMAEVISQSGRIVERDGERAVEVPPEVLAQLVRRLNEKIYDDMIRDAMIQGYGISRKEGDKFESLEQLLDQAVKNYQMPVEHAAHILACRKIALAGSRLIDRNIKAVREKLGIGYSNASRN